MAPLCFSLWVKFLCCIPSTKKAAVETLQVLSRPQTFLAPGSQKLSDIVNYRIRGREEGAVYIYGRPAGGRNLSSSFQLGVTELGTCGFFSEKAQFRDPLAREGPGAFSADH